MNPIIDMSIITVNGISGLWLYIRLFIYGWYVDSKYTAVPGLYTDNLSPIDITFASTIATPHIILGIIFLSSIVIKINGVINKNNNTSAIYNSFKKIIKDCVVNCVAPPIYPTNIVLK